MKNKGITIYPPSEIAMNDANCAPVTLSEDGERLVASTIKRWSMPWIRIAIPNDPPPERFQGYNLSTSDSVDSGTIYEGRTSSACDLWTTTTNQTPDLNGKP